MKMIAGLTLAMFGAIVWVILGGVVMQARGVQVADFFQGAQLFLWAPLPVVIGVLAGWFAGELPDGEFWKPAYGWTMLFLVVLALAGGFVLSR